MITPMSMAEVAAYLREIRRGRGFTQESLAEIVGVSKRTIERLERNEGALTVEIFEQIIAALRASPEQVHYLATHSEVNLDEAQSLAAGWLRGAIPSTARRQDPIKQASRSASATTVRLITELSHLEADEIIDLIDLLIDLLREKQTQR